VKSSPADEGRSPGPGDGAANDRPPLWLELTADYRCNNRCIGCHSADDAAPGMDRDEALQALVDGRARGARSLWLGGGEPTLRPDLPLLINAARKLGYESIKLQTNGMRLAYADYTHELARLGVTEVSFSVKGARRETHDRLTQTVGCYDLMMEGFRAASDAGLTIEADYLAYRTNAGELAKTLGQLRQWDVRLVRLWILYADAASVSNSVEDADADAAAAAAAEVPRISDVLNQARAAVAAGFPAARLSSLHTPPCTLGPALAPSRFFAADLDLEIVNPGGHRFWLEQSPMEGGTFLPGCNDCAARTRCLGIRASYLDRYGGSEFVPLMGSPPRDGQAR
jgi:MoaA/NifB/PqqE/SkfB family radical SAM enzyme